jgi:hypothetical protein
MSDERRDGAGIDGGGEPAKLDELARAWAEADLAEADLDALSEASTERILRAAAGEASAEEIEALARVAASDPGTSFAWRLAQGLRDEPAAPALVALPAPAPSAPPRIWRPGRIVAALAAAVLVAAGLGLFLPDRDEPRWREGDSGFERAVASEDGARRPRAALLLRWQQLPDPATRYAVRVSTADLKPVFEADDLVATEITVPETALAPYPAGTTLYWQVEARGPDGALRTSPAVRVVLDD